MEDNKARLIIKSKLDYLLIFIFVVLGAASVWFVFTLISGISGLNNATDKIIISAFILCYILIFCGIFIGSLGRRVRKIEANEDGIVVKTYLFKYKFAYTEISSISEESSYAALKNPIYWVAIKRYHEIILSIIEVNRDKNVKVRFYSERFDRNDVKQLIAFASSKLSEKES